MGQHPASEASGRSLRIYTRIALIAVSYFLASRLALLFPDSHRVLSALWPAGGVALAGLLLSPRRQWSAIAAAICAAGVAASLTAGRSLPITLGFMAANAVESLGSAWLIQRWCGPEIRFGRIREVGALMASAVFVNGVSASIGAGTAALAAHSGFGSFWFNWWIVDGLGILLITPLIVTWRDCRDVFRDAHWTRVLESLALAAVLAFSAWSSFHMTTNLRAVSPRPYMVIGLLAWCGLRFGQRTVTVVLVGLAAIAVTSKAINLEPFIGHDETAEERLITIQIYLAVVGGSGLLLAAAYSEAKSAEAQIRAVGDNLPEGAVYQVLRERDGQKSFLYLSAGIERITGLSPAEIMGDPHNYYSRVFEEDKPAYAEAERAAVASMTPFRATYRIRRPDGEIRWVQSTSSPRPLREGRIIWDGILTDITQTRQAEDDLRNSEARFRTLIEDAPIAIAVSRNQRLVYASPTLIRMFGFESETLDGHDLSIFDFFAPECREQIAQRSDRRRMGLPEPREYESVGLRRDGSPFPILLSVSGIELPEGRAVVAFITDLTRMRQSEEERAKLEQQLRQAQKLESIGRLAGGVAHDFNNLLTVINGFSTLLTQKLDNQSRLWSYADQVRKSGERGASLTRQLLAFSRQEVIKPVPLNLNRTIADSVPMVRRLIGEDIALSTRLDPELGYALADTAQIDQVILNLAANARDAMPHGGRLEISTYNFDREQDGKTERWVAVTVTDNGVGMDEATKQHIFEPFFTTKGVGKGTGLGLATVYGVMQQNGGWIDVHSAAGEGTTFELCFPRIDAPMAPPAEKELVAERVYRGERILLVEDDTPVRDFLRSVLEERGYHVVEALDGPDAVDIARKQRHEIHLLITDVVMPGMNGKQLSERLRQERPSLKVIFLSGYSTAVIGHRGILERDVAFLQKPVNPEVLIAKVHDVLNGTAV